MFVVTTLHITILVISLIAIAGWVISYTEYNKRVKIIDLNKHATDLLTKTYKEDLEKLEKHYAAKVESIIVEKDTQISDLIRTREIELEEAETLIKEKLEEINRSYQEVIDEQNASLEVYEKYIKNFDATIQMVNERLKLLDEKGVFNTDDEIGFFFGYVKSLQSILDNFKVEKEELDNKE